MELERLKAEEDDRVRRLKEAELQENNPSDGDIEAKEKVDGETPSV